MSNNRIESLQKITGFSNVILLSGDASERKFYRGKCKDNISYIIMDYQKNIGIKEKEFQILRAYGLLKMYEIKIPKIYNVFPNEGLIIQQDAGDTSLSVIVNNDLVSEYELKKIYLNAMNEIIKIKNIPVLLIKNIKGEIFTKEKLEWEANFFIKYYLEKFKSKILSDKEKNILNLFFNEINETVYASVGFPIHRDFHSRNLLHFNNKVFTIDYQDLRVGPDHYDITSLLWDSYVDLEDELKDYLLRRYIEFCGKEYGNEINLVRCTAIQRNLKAIGTFSYLALEKNKTNFLNHIPLTLKHFEQNFKLLSFDPEILSMIK
ncbi:MAG: phosphotransferase [bacterium]|nr:phosphotransferase [bacterium]